jgi:hypothetical protein
MTINYVITNVQGDQKLRYFYFLTDFYWQYKSLFDE